ncbi:hypothetical protein ACLOJK_013252 [Asimina triloba]
MLPASSSPNIPKNPIRISLLKSSNPQSSSSQAGGAPTHDLLVFVFKRWVDHSKLALRTCAIRDPSVRSCSKKHNEGDCWPLDIEPETKDKCRRRKRRTSVGEGYSELGGFLFQRSGFFSEEAEGEFQDREFPFGGDGSTGQAQSVVLW